MSAAPVLANLFDPRGRCNRKGLMVTALALLLVQVAVGLAMWAADVSIHALVVKPVKIAVLWIATVALLKRLHDVGASGWALLWALIATFVWTVLVAGICVSAFGPAVAEIGSSPFLVYLTLVSAPLLAAMLWLHVVPGDAGPNRYGPAPDASGFSMPPAVSTPDVALRTA
ncbi:MAG: DUF805 domain-containing protein [Hyphomicrobiaceae bacterium]|nr:DUF805 domain-containing protein [Hyphomicrobiaceae bacterium]